MKLLLSEIAAATGGRLIGENLSISGISTDSRKIAAGSLFIPIIGENHDAHSFIGMAMQNGASSFLTDREREEKPYVLVKDTRRAIMDLAAYYRSLFNIPVVGVTGSVGKTSVKNGIAAVLSQKYNVLKTEGNFNNEIGLPLTVFKLEQNHDAAVFEMGMNSFGEISRLSRIVKPDIGVITNVGTAHIERLGGREGILQAKLEILDGMNENGTLVLNCDNDMLRSVEGKMSQKTVWVSASEKADIYAADIKKAADGKFLVNIRYGDRIIDTLLKSAETPHVQNALMAASVGFLLGLTDNEVKLGLEAGVPEKGRLEIHKTKTGGVIINDSYNANLDSMKLALDVLSRYNMEKIAVLGDMFELGEYAREFHQEIGQYAYAKGIDVLIAIGADAKYYKEAFDAVNKDGRKSCYYKEKQEFFNAGIGFEGEKAVLIKASRGMKFEDILDYINNCGE